jgi:hypothetical protein
MRWLAPEITAILLVVFAQPTPSIFEVDLWPEEGRPVFAASATTLPLRETPTDAAAVAATWTGRVGQTLPFDDTRYRTTRAGRFIVLLATTISGRQLGDAKRLSRADYYAGKYERVRLDLRQGDAVEYLQYRAEGSCFVRVAAVVIEADRCPNQQPRVFRLESEPKTELWIRVVHADAAGWLLVTDATARIVRRQG